MRILITGGAGFIGSSVAAGYIGAGHDVTIVDDLSTGRMENIPPEAHFFKADIRDFAQLGRIFSEVSPDVVNHHAAQMDIRRSLREPLFDAGVNILGTLSLLEACVQHSVKKIIFASSGGAIYGEPKQLPATESTQELPISHYGVAKLAVERYLHAYKHLYGLPSVVLRYANVYGPRQNPHGEAGVVAIFTGQMLHGEVPTIFGDGSKTRDYVFVDDIVAANLLALSRQESGIFNIGSGIQVSDYGIFDAIRRCVGFTLEPKYASRRAGEVEFIALDPTAASIGLGWRPKVGLLDGIGKTVEHIRSQVGT
jgi:UDP-glucose 4-epimerase